MEVFSSICTAGAKKKRHDGRPLAAKFTYSQEILLTQEKIIMEKLSAWFIFAGYIYAGLPGIFFQRCLKGYHNQARFH